MAQSVDVLVVGAGPAGLTSAYILQRYGINVKIIERRQEDYYIGARAQGFQPPTIQTYDRLGLLPQFKHLLGDVDDAHFYKFGTLEIFQQFPFVGAPHAETPVDPYINTKMFPQPCLEKILRNALKGDARVNWEHELVSTKEEKDHIIATVQNKRTNEEYQIKARYLIGCDSARSVSRKCAGLHLIGESLEKEEGIIAEIDIESPGDFSKGLHMIVDEKRNFMSFVSVPELLAPHHYISIFGCPPDLIAAADLRDQYAGGSDRDHNLDAIQHLWSHCTGLSDDLFKITNVYFASKWRPSARIANKFANGHTFVAGDAAHCHPPHGGQGLNTSVSDASNLAWKLALALKGLASPKILDSYDLERRPVVAAMLRLTAQIFAEDRKKEEGDSRVNEARHGEQVRQMGINYRGSPLVINDPSDIITKSAATFESGTLTESAYSTVEGVAGGIRTRDSPLINAVSGEKTTLYDLLRGLKHNILIFSVQSVAPDQAEESPEIKQFIKAFGGSDYAEVSVILPAGTTDKSSNLRFIDCDSWAFKTYFPHRCDTGGVVVVRPDGFVGAVFDKISKLHKYTALLQ